MADEQEQNDNPEEETQETTTPTRRSFLTRLGLNNEEFEGEGTAVSRNEALRLIVGRLPMTKRYNDMVKQTQNDPVLNSEGGSFFGGRDVSMGAPERNVLAQKILAAIPDEMLTKEILSEGDLRPFMLAVLQETDVDEGGQVNGTKVNSTERAVLSWVLQDETKRIQAQVEAVLVAGVDVANDPQASQKIEDARLFAENYAYDYRNGTVNRIGAYETKDDGTPVNPRSAQNAAAAWRQEALDKATEDVTPYRFVSGKQLREMLQSDEMTFEEAHQLEQQSKLMVDEKGDPIEYFGTKGRVIYTDEERRVQQNPTKGRPSSFASKDWYTISEILRKPNEFSREEAMKMHERLKASGMYDMVGGEPTVPGDVTDGQFQRAWKLLAQNSLEKGVSMTSLLEEREQAMKAAEEAALAVALTDPARLRLNGDAFARDAIGRKLTPDEQEQMVKFLHDLERRNARIDAGLEVTATGEPIEGVEGLDEGIMADIDARMQEWIRMDNPDEAGARDVVDQYDAFTRMLGGPGRGGSF